MANTAWSATDKTAGITLTGSNVIATAAATGQQAARAADRQATGKFYWETAFTTITGSCFAGVANQGWGLSNVQASTIGAFLLQSTGAANYNGAASLLPSLGAFSAGGVACWALDALRGLLFVRNGAAGNWNGSATANPATGDGGLPIFDIGGLGLLPLYPCVSFLNANTTGQVTGNFGDSAFSGVVPSGYTSGFTAGASIPTSVLVPGVIRETLLSTPGSLRVSGMVRETLLSTPGSLRVSGMVREVLRTTSVALPRGNQAMILA